MSYEPRPDTLAFRALAHMEMLHKGSEISNSTLAAALGVIGSALIACLEPAVKARAIFSRQKGGHARSPLFWSLVDHTGGAAVAPAPGPQVPLQSRAVGRDESNGPSQAQFLPAGVVKQLSKRAPRDVANGIDIDDAHRTRDNVIEMETPQKGANRDASAGQSHDAAGSESPNGRGTDGASALGAAPAFIPASAPPVDSETLVGGAGPALQPPQPRPYRYGIFNDGEFVQEKDNQRIVIDRGELEGLVAFFQRMVAA